MRAEAGRNGVEIEGYVQDRNLINDRCLGFKHKSAVKTFKEKIDSRFYLDDGKVEYPTYPASNLEILFANIKDIIGQIKDICERKDWIYSLIGCHPFASSFASYHVHTSLKRYPEKPDIRKVRLNLLDAQPYIALLSQNSPVLAGSLTNYKDIRLAHSHWSEFTKPTPDGRASSSHYLSLAKGRKAYTLECRIPSSCTLHQGEAILVFIKTLVEKNLHPILPANNLKDMYFRVLKWGGQALVPVPSAKRLDFRGTLPEMFLPISELFSLFLEDKTIQPVFKEILEELPQSDREPVVEYFKLIARGYTLSDFTQTLCEINDYDIVKTSEALSEITFKSYLENKPVWKLMPMPELPVLPKVENVYTVEEALSLLSSYQLPIKYDKSQDLDYLLNTSKYSLRNCLTTRLILKSFLKKPCQRLSELRIPQTERSEVKKIFLFLYRMGIFTSKLEEKEEKYYPTKDFSYLVQLGQEYL